MSLDEIRIINEEKDKIITKAYVNFRETQQKAKQDAKAKILKLTEKPIKSSKKE